MRVITGSARGRRLKALKGMATRPTTDRAKESLFNIIGNRVINVNFLDLFAGTGAIGIEALSRGAFTAVFVEKNPQAVKIIKDNLELTGLKDRAEVLDKDVQRAIEHLSFRNRQFDLVFLDPPYHKGLIPPTLEKLSHYKLLSPGGLAIAESSKLEALPDEISDLKKFREEKYGDTLLSFYQHTSQEYSKKG